MAFIKTCYTIQEAGAEVRRQLSVKRNPIHFIYEMASEDYYDGLIDDILAEALRHTGKPKEGDSLKRTFLFKEASDDWKKAELLLKEDGTSVYLISITLKEYRMTLDQEKKVDKKIAEIKKKLDLDGKTDYEKARAIYDYICKNVTYDHDHDDDPDNKRRTIYYALFEGKSNCDGVAALFYRLALEAGLEVRFVTGYGYVTQMSTHAWNIVKVDGRNYIVDATWDLENGKLNPPKYKWFLTGSRVSYHIPIESKTLAGCNRFNSEDLNNCHYPISKEDYMNSQVERNTKDTDGGFFQWELSGGKLVISGSGEMPDYSLEHPAPWSGRKIVSVEVKTGITTVGSRAFCYQSELTDVSLPADITMIGEQAFAHCEKFCVTIPEKAVVIKERAFYGCAASKKLVIPWYVTQIETQAFGKIGGLEEVEFLRTGNFYLADGAFSECPDLKKVKYNLEKTAPESKEKFYAERVAFRGCMKLEEFEICGIPEKEKEKEEKQERSWNLRKRLFQRQNSVKYITIRRIDSIEKHAFRELPSLCRVILSECVTAIGEYAFYGCTGLTEIEIPESVENLGEQAFRDCSNLKSVRIPGKVSTIGEAAFLDCTGLTELTIEYGAETIGKQAFKNCSGLAGVNIPGSVKTIGKSTFYGCTGLTEIEIPESVETIGESAFYGCTGLTEIEIPESVKTIGKQAFTNCENLTSITIPDGVTSIDNFTFYGCLNLKSITIPKTVTSIGRKAFYGCSSLTEAHYNGDPKNIVMEEGNDCLNKVLQKDA